MVGIFSINLCRFSTYKMFFFLNLIATIILLLLKFKDLNSTSFSTILAIKYWTQADYICVLRLIRHVKLVFVLLNLNCIVSLTFSIKSFLVRSTSPTYVFILSFFFSFTIYNKDTNVQCFISSSFQIFIIIVIVMNISFL
jgi:hypothetical protein